MEARPLLDIRASLRSQFHAALGMLRQTVDRCPEALWVDESNPNRFWHVAYHSLFYVHLYLQRTLEDFRPWPGHRPNHQYLGATPQPPHELPQLGAPYTRQEILAYLDFCHAEVDARLADLDPGLPSGFHWLPFGKLELQIYNLRHLQQQVGELSGRLQDSAGVALDWVGTAGE